jgi:hypothetical protein
MATCLIDLRATMPCQMPLQTARNLPKFLKHAGQVMRTAARLHPHDCRRQFGKKFLHMPAPQLTLQHHFARGINPVNLEHVLR